MCMDLNTANGRKKFKKKEAFGTIQQPSVASNGECKIILAHKHQYTIARI